MGSPALFGGQQVYDLATLSRQKPVCAQCRSISSVQLYAIVDTFSGRLFIGHRKQACSDA